MLGKRVRPFDGHVMVADVPREEKLPALHGPVAKDEVESKESKPGMCCKASVSVAASKKSKSRGGKQQCRYSITTKKYPISDVS